MRTPKTLLAAGGALASLAIVFTGVTSAARLPPAAGYLSRLNEGSLLDPPR